MKIGSTVALGFISTGPFAQQNALIVTLIAMYPATLMKSFG